MTCLLTLLALMTPRLVTFILWLFTDWFKGTFDGVFWPILGFIFMPTTLLWCSAVQNWFGGRWGFGAILGLVIAIMIDLSPAGGARRRRRRG
jgi:hypothetical protein